MLHAAYGYLHHKVYLTFHKLAASLHGVIRFSVVHVYNFILLSLFHISMFFLMLALRNDQMFSINMYSTFIWSTIKCVKLCRDGILSSWPSAQNDE